MAIDITLKISEDLARRILERNDYAVDGLEKAIEDTLENAYPAKAAETPAHTEIPESLSIEEQRELVREAMKDIIAPADWMDGLLELWGGPMTPEEIEEYDRNLPVLDPPLSQTIIEMRDEERY
jgi:hypothetical protein